MKFNLLFSLGLCLLALLLVNCRKTDGDYLTNMEDAPLTTYSINVPNYFPQLIIPTDNPLTVEGILLGRMLYYDTILSNIGKSCSSCHTQANSFSDSTVNSLPHMNLAWSDKFLWNGSKEGTLENVMIFEVEDFFGTDVNKLNNHTSYPNMFKKVFKTNPITSRQIAYALAQFVRTQTSTNSKFDQYLRYETMLTSSEINGFVIYNSEKGDCFHCHSLGLFFDNNFHNIGLDSTFIGVDKGRYNVTHNPDDIGKFKTPSLRNIALTAPYMHDGRFATLEQVIEHYNSGVKTTATLDPILSKPNHLYGLQLTLQEKIDLISFLNTLTDTTFTNNPSLSTP